MSKKAKKAKASKVKAKIKVGAKTPAKVEAPARPRNRLINFKVTAADRRLIEKLANKYAQGNLSDWCRSRALKVTPQTPGVAPSKLNW